MTRTRRIVADSSANVLQLGRTEFANAPLKVITDEREFTDNEALNMEDMLAHFATYKGKSKTSCPNTEDWLAAFGDADDVFCVTITSGLSGSYNSARIAKQMYEEEHPDKKVCVIDSLSVGPEAELIIEKLEELIVAETPFEEICETIAAYQQKTALLFTLESLKNLAANGRVSPIVAKVAGVLDIRMVGKASDQGTLELMDKCRGEERALKSILAHLQEFGLETGKVRLAHCENEKAALRLKALIEQAVPAATVEIRACRGLCSYYAEKGGMLIGFERF